MRKFFVICFVVSLIVFVVIVFLMSGLRCFLSLLSSLFWFYAIFFLRSYFYVVGYWDNVYLCCAVTNSGADIKYNIMDSKILIDVDDSGSSVISVRVPVRDFSDVDDVRDKLVKHFLDAGNFCFVSYSGDIRDNFSLATISSMNVLDILERIVLVYGYLFNDSDSFREFEQAIFSVASKIEGVTSLRSDYFLRRCEAQSLV